MFRIASHFGSEGSKKTKGRRREPTNMHFPPRCIYDVVSLFLFLLSICKTFFPLLYCADVAVETKSDKVRQLCTWNKGCIHKYRYTGEHSSGLISAVDLCTFYEGHVILRGFCPSAVVLVFTLSFSILKVQLISKPEYIVLQEMS